MATDMLTTAENARTAVNGMLRSLDLAAFDLGYEYVAELLDTDTLTLRRRLDGDEDMTLTQLRQLAIATGMTLTIDAVATELVGAV